MERSPGELMLETGWDSRRGIKWSPREESPGWGCGVRDGRALPRHLRI